MSYCKLFSSVTQSSLWSESYPTRLLFISMLAAADAEGFVESSLSGLSRLSNITIEETRSAVCQLESPDADSKDQEFEGRRIVKVEGGWVILNYVKYRNRKDEESRKRYIREYMRKYRADKAGDAVNDCKQPVNSKCLRKPQAEGEGEAEAEAEERGRGKTTPPPTEVLKLEGETLEKRSERISDDEIFLRMLEADPTYKHLNIRREYGKMVNWCKANSKQPTRKRFINWVNKCDQPMKVRVENHAVLQRRNFVPGTGNL